MFCQDRNYEALWRQKVRGRGKKMDTGCKKRMQDTGYRIQDARAKIQETKGK